MTRATQASFLLLVLTASVRAEAQAEAPQTGFGDKGHVAISIERMFGYVHETETDLFPGATSASTTTRNTISLLGSASETLSSVYTFPRIGFDAFLAPSISVGGSATYFHFSTLTGIGETTQSGFLVAPRIGFAVRISRSLWIWPRAGFSYVHVSGTIRGNSLGASNLLAATAEVPVVIALAPRIFASIGPTADVGIWGKTEDPAVNFSSPGSVPTIDVKETDLGLQAAFLFDF